MFRPLLYASLCIGVLASCGSETFDERTANLNKGKLVIYAESSYKVLVEELIQSYENVYPESDLEAVYTSDAQLREALMQDRTRMAISGTALTPEQKKAIMQVQKIMPEEFPIGREAIAIIASTAFADSVFDYDLFRQPQQHAGDGAYAKTRFVFNRENSSMIYKLLENRDAPSNMFSLENIDSLTRYVANDPQAIGFISFAAIADFDDPQARATMQGIKVLYVAMTDTTGEKTVIPLSQSSIATGEYPFQRYITVIKGNTPELLGTGFVNFLYRSKASRIMLKGGIVPEKMPERQVKIKE